MMRFIELTDAAYKAAKILINVDNIVSISSDGRRGLGLNKAGAVIQLNTDPIYIRVAEDYETIKEIIERM
jgi:hypothetical protein